MFGFTELHKNKQQQSIINDDFIHTAAMNKLQRMVQNLWRKFGRMLSTSCIFWIKGYVTTGGRYSFNVWWYSNVETILGLPEDAVVNYTAMNRALSLGIAGKGYQHKNIKDSSTIQAQQVLAPRFGTASKAIDNALWYYRTKSNHANRSFVKLIRMDALRIGNEN